MVLPTTLRFARVARALSTEARRLGLEAPGFRSPPGLPESDRTIRRAHWGTVVAVRLRGRPFAHVANDMVEGVVRANALDEAAADRLRERLSEVVAEVDTPPAPPPSGNGGTAPHDGPEEVVRQAA